MTVDQEIDRATLTADGCLIAHPGATGKGGYRLFYDDAGKLVQLHRAIVMQDLGRTLTTDELVLHSCHKPRCIALDHLRIGTDEERSNAMVAAGRHAYGERQPMHKLTANEVVNVHYLRRAGYLYREIARQFDVSDTLCRYICIGHKWKRVYDAIHGHAAA